jgi:hypothetical protein
VLSIHQDKRLWFIELIAWWEGRISASHLIRQFGICRTQAQKEVLAHDYQMQNGKFLIQIRACLPQYVLQEMQVNIRDIDISPETQQLVLINHNDIKPWLFEEKS